MVSNEIAADASGSVDGAAMSPTTAGYPPQGVAGGGGALQGLLQAMEAADVERQSKLHSAQVRRKDSAALDTHSCTRRESRLCCSPALARTACTTPPPNSLPDRDWPQVLTCCRMHGVEEPSAMLLAVIGDVTTEDGRVDYVRFVQQLAAQRASASARASVVAGVQV